MGKGARARTLAQRRRMHSAHKRLGISHYEYMRSVHKKRRASGDYRFLQENTIVVRGRRYRIGQKIYPYPSMARTHGKTAPATASQRVELRKLRKLSAASHQRRRQRKAAGTIPVPKPIVARGTTQGAWPNIYQMVGQRTQRRQQRRSTPRGNTWSFIRPRELTW